MASSLSLIFGGLVLKGQSISFLLPQYIPVAPGCCSVLAGDFNRDGKEDIVVAYSASHVMVFLGDGTGKFNVQKSAPSQEGSTISKLVGVADINSDGIPDILAIGDTGPLALLGNGDGSFRAPAVLNLGGDLSKAIADFNGDGKPDLLAYSANSSGFVVHLGNGDGTFQPAGPQAVFPQGDFAIAVVGDFNTDGKLDVAWTTARNSPQVFVWLGKGDGSFQNFVASPSPLAETFKQLAVGDFNQDGKPDLAIATQHRAGLLLGNGDGTFRPGPTYTAPLSLLPVTAQLVVADFNGDGLPDLADGFMVLLGNGDGTLQTPLTFGQWVNPPPGGTGTFLAAADFNGDGKIDVVGAAGDGTVLSVLINDTPSIDASVFAVSGADYGGAVAPGMIATAFGKALTDATASASALPLPTVLQNTKLRILDQNGAERLAPLIYVSPSQINFVVPQDTAFGYAIINVDDGKLPLVQGARATLVKGIAPGFFTMDGTGHGPPAATAVAIQNSGMRTTIPVFQCSATRQCTLTPIDLSANGTVYLSVYGTGFAQATQGVFCWASNGAVSIPVTYSGPQRQFPGLDQLNIRLPILVPSGTVDINCSFHGTTSGLPETASASFTISVK